MKGLNEKPSDPLTMALVITFSINSQSPTLFNHILHQCIKHIYYISVSEAMPMNEKIYYFAYLGKLFSYGIFLESKNYFSGPFYW